MTFSSFRNCHLSSVNETNVKMIRFEEIDQLFGDDYQVGVLDARATYKTGQIPLKGYCHAGRTVIFHQKTQAYWRSLQSSLVVMHYSKVAYDYTIKPKSVKILQQKFPQVKLITYDYKTAAIEAGLAMRGNNTLAWSTEFGFDCKITAFGFTEKIIGYEKPKLPATLPDCEYCSICIDACPGCAFANRVFDREKCESVIGPQVKSYVSKLDPVYRRLVIPWQGVAEGIKSHCRVCQSLCAVKGRYQKTRENKHVRQSAVVAK